MRKQIVSLGLAAVMASFSGSMQQLFFRNHRRGGSGLPGGSRH